MKNRDLASIFARCLLGGKASPMNISYLNASQNNCAAELIRIVKIYGGALLANPVGSGKTRIAIAVASQFGSNRIQKICVIGPARIRNHWILEAKKCGILEIEFYSHAFLSQNENVEPISDFVVVDEAHRFRNPNAKRSIHLKAILDSRPCLLVSATPFVNREADLITLIRYFMDDEDARKQLGIDPENANQEDLKSMLYAMCVRRSYEDIPTLNTCDIEYELSDKELSFWALFPSALAGIHFEALKQEWPDRLVRHFLSQQFRYGFAALESSLNSIIFYYEEWLSAAGKNLGMNRRFFSEAFPNGQLPLTFMYPESRWGEHGKVEQDLKQLRALMAMLSGIENDSREDAIVQLCSNSERILVFTSRIDVAESLFKRCLGEKLRVGMVHSKRALMSGIGEAEPEEIVSKFRDKEGVSRDQIAVLIATDCLSEGISFPECSDLILVDVPDTAVKIEQRIGRIVRLNSISEISKVYVLKPTNVTSSLSFSTFAKRKSKKSTLLGFRYALAANLLGEEELAEDPFSILLECRDILTEIDSDPSYLSLASGNQFLIKGADSKISSLALVRFLDEQETFSFHWVATVNGKTSTTWSDIREPLFGLSRSKEADVVHDDVPFSDEEKCHFDTLINRRNLIRFHPSPKQRDDSLSRRLAQKVSGFALSAQETQHVNQVLCSPFSRARRLRLECMCGIGNAAILQTLLEMKVDSVSKLVYELVIRIRFTQ